MAGRVSHLSLLAMSPPQLSGYSVQPVFWMVMGLTPVGELRKIVCVIRIENALSFTFQSHLLIYQARLN